MARETLLIVEDDAAIRELLRYNIGREGYAIVECSSAGEAQAALARAVPDLILLDLLVPGTDGLAFCRALRADERTARLPVILLTACDEKADIAAGLDAGADDVLIKPFSTRGLLVRVRAALRHKRGHRSGLNFQVVKRLPQMRYE